jgi:hypothetical protein
LISAVDDGEWSTLHPLYFQKISPGTHCVGGSMGPRVGLDVVEEIKISCSLLRIEPRSFSLYLVTIPTELLLN